VPRQVWQRFGLLHVLVTFWIGSRGAALVCLASRTVVGLIRIDPFICATRV